MRGTLALKNELTSCFFRANTFRNINGEADISITRKYKEILQHKIEHISTDMPYKACNAGAYLRP